MAWQTRRFFVLRQAPTEAWMLRWRLTGARAISVGKIARSPLVFATMAQFLTGPKTRSHLVSSIQKSRSEEHTSELQSLAYLVCRLLLEKKKKKKIQLKQQKKKKKKQKQIKSRNRR